jgi:TPR repeat protein
MIRCKGCGRENPKYEVKCPSCGASPILAEGECEMLLSEAEELILRNDFLHAVEIYKFLAAAGSADGERELGLILERGLLLPRDLDMAIRYFYSAAMKGDALSAYKYSRLVVGKQALSDFWLAFAALMECKEAYPDAFAMYTGYKQKSTAAYYCSLIAAEDDTDAIIEMARRHLYGDGVEQNEKQAKWYMERIERAPLHALKLQRRLQAVTGRAIQPEQPVFTEKKRIIQRLITASRKYGYTKILLKLCQLYAIDGDADANVFLALLHIEGIEFTQNVELGVSMLEEAASRGSVMGAKCLGDLYAKGEFTEPDNRLATHYYRTAAELGGQGEYENLGDIFRLGHLTEPDYALCISLYEKGAKEGDFGCQKKLKMMHEEREQCYIEATRLERTAPEEAFKLFKKSVELGYLPAHARIGWYYERGIGTKVNRKAAFYHYNTAYDAGDKRAIESLGRCYARGIGVAFDFDKASKLLSVAREMGSHSADRELYRIYENKKRHMVRSLYSTAMKLYYNKKYDIAVNMLETCMNLGLGDATYSIGCLYEFGITTEPDRKTALRYYKKASEQGFSDPRQYHKQSMLKIWKKNK